MKRFSSSTLLLFSISLLFLHFDATVTTTLHQYNAEIPTQQQFHITESAPINMDRRKLKLNPDWADFYNSEQMGGDGKKGQYGKNKDKDGKKQPDVKVKDAYNAYKASFYFNPGWFPSELPAFPALSEFQKHQSSNYYPNPQYGLMLQQILPAPRPPPFSKNVSPLFSNFAGYVGPVVWDEGKVVAVVDDDEEEDKKHEKKKRKTQYYYEKFKDQFSGVSDMYHLLF